MPAKPKPVAKKATPAKPKGVLTPTKVWQPTPGPAPEGEVDLVFYRRAIAEKPEVLDALQAKGLIPDGLTIHQSVLKLIESAPDLKSPAVPPAPKQSRTHVSLEAWLGHPENVIRLKQILADPVFVAACHYVEGMAGVANEDLFGANAALSEVIVRKAAFANGVKTFATTLAAMPNFRKKDAATNPEPWDYIQAPLTR